MTTTSISTTAISKKHSKKNNDLKKISKKDSNKPSKKPSSRIRFIAIVFNEDEYADWVLMGDEKYWQGPLNDEFIDLGEADQRMGVLEEELEEAGTNKWSRDDVLRRIAEEMLATRPLTMEYVWSTPFGIDDEIDSDDSNYSKYTNPDTHIKHAMHARHIMVNAIAWSDRKGYPMYGACLLKLKTTRTDTQATRNELMESVLRSVISSRIEPARNQPVHTIFKEMSLVQDTLIICVEKNSSYRDR